MLESDWQYGCCDMIEDEHSFKDIWKSRKKPENPCRVCGGIPVLVTGYDEMDKWWYIKCKCGIYINMDIYPYGTDPYDVWERLNGDTFTPSGEPKYMGESERCCTCLMKNRCTVAKNMDIHKRTLYKCKEYQEESIESR